MTSINDLRAAFFGGYGDAEKTFLEAQYAAGRSAADLITELDRGGKWPAASYVQAEGPVTTTAMTTDRLIASSIWIPEARNGVELVLDMTVSGVGGTPVLRTGVMSLGTDGRPNSLLEEFGTIDASVAPGLLTQVIDFDFTRGLYWVVVAAQGATVTQPTLRTVNKNSQFVTPSALSVVSNRSGYMMNAVAGALPASYVVNSSNTPGVWFAIKSAA